MKFLIVEDSKFAQLVTKRLFSEAFPAGQIYCSPDGAAGYNDFLRLKPDVIVTDLLMPVMNGQEFIKRIRLLDPSVMIVIVTADIQQLTKKELEEYNIAAFINKPLDPEKVTAVKQLLEGKSHDQ